MLQASPPVQDMRNKGWDAFWTCAQLQDRQPLQTDVIISKNKELTCTKLFHRSANFVRHTMFVEGQARGSALKRAFVFKKKKKEEEKEGEDQIVASRQLLSGEWQRLRLVSEVDNAGMFVVSDSFDAWRKREMPDASRQLQQGSSVDAVCARLGLPGSEARITRFKLDMPCVAGEQQT